MNPSHYRKHPSGIECIRVVEGFNFNLGNAIKYVWRAGLKGDDPLEDLDKASKYIEFEMARIQREMKSKTSVEATALTDFRFGQGEETTPGSWNDLIQKEMDKWGDSFGDVLSIAPRDLDLSRQGQPFTLWTTNRVYFPVTYDGDQWVGSAPRNPNGEITQALGGG